MVKILLMIVAVMIPLWFLPLPVPLEFGREVTFSLIIVAAFIFWLLSLLTRGEMRYPSSLILWASGFLTVTFGVSALLSKTALISFVFGDPIAEKFSSLILGVLLMLVSSSLFTQEKDVNRILALLIGAGGIAGLISFFQLAWGVSLLSNVSIYAQGNTFNVVGTMNGFALFLDVLFVITLGLLFSATEISMKTRTRSILAVILAIMMLDMIMIHSFIAWIVLLGSLIFFFGLMVMHMRGSSMPEAEERQRHTIGLGWRYVVLILLIAFSVVMLVVKTPLFGSANLPAEVSPSFTATLSVGQQVLKEGTRALFFGSGPATFSLDWARYRNPIINQTQFWNVSFPQGFSWLTTMVSTAGILGVSAFVMFLGLALVIFLRHLLRFPYGRHAPVRMSILLGFVAMILILILYPSSLTFLLLLFFLVGILMALLTTGWNAELSGQYREEETVHSFEENNAQEVSQEYQTYKEEKSEGEIKIVDGEVDRETETHSSRPGWLGITGRTVYFDSPWLVFVSSLSAIFLLSVGVGAMYLEIGRLRAALVGQQAAVMFNKGDIDGAIAEFEKSATFEDKNFAHYVPLVQARIEKIRRLIGRAAGGNNVQQEFQNTVSLAIQNSQQAINLNPASPVLWRLQGSLYELLIPFIPGSENFAFGSYRKAIELDPINPALDIDLARAGLAAVDRLTLTMQQSRGNDRDQMLQVRTKSLEEIMTVLQRAIDIKPDLADSHFLMTQSALRLGNMSAAIQSAEKAKLAAPFDIGTAFQLGLLYYQAGDTDKAQLEFERAVALNNNYSNARYFLGLIYDRKGDTTRAIQQFEQIQALNPDNQEVKHILENLHAGKPALQEIVPPAQPPEKRSVTPVKEEKAKGNK